MFDKSSAQRLVGPQAVIAISSIVVLLVTLCLLAVSHSGALATMLVVVEGLAAATIILFRQLRKTTQSLIASEARAQHSAQHDAVTALPNRVRFLGRLGEDLEQLRRAPGFLAVIGVGIDQYHQVKDAFGYRCADLLIEEAARRLSALRPAGLMVGRIAADEFALAETDPDKLDALVALVREAIARPFPLSTGSSFVTCSIGISAVADERIDADELLRRADIALRKSRQSGRGGVSLYEPAMDSALQTRNAVEGELRAALRAGELVMAYQPQANAQGAIVGVEALARWTHKVRGDIPPEYFVSLAEESDLIHDLSRFTINQAFLDAQRWPDLRVAINVSSIFLARPDFLSQVTMLLSATHADPRRFEIEITESVLLGRDEQTQHNLRGLRGLGLSLALDDFGVGYSSLGYLLQHSVDRIKIDRLFVLPLGRDPGVDAVVEAMIKLADALNLRVMAEGVETEAQRARLTELGCREFQGYLVSAPLTVSEIDHLVVVGPALAA